MTLDEYIKNLDKYVEPLDVTMKKNGDWEKLVRIMKELAKIEHL
ncbi:hypothetical protein [Mycoplasma leonicaptivi]|nr:hypothetical protein [Mycoplasma leonicaptivi]